ncbi:hypothetical protein NO275_08370, partial [Campylobacter jejuni]|uniref:hypothetical protein n=1 Tax=Campylobacter jejuni TaxID=197 RepID=UPI0027DEF959
MDNNSVAKAANPLARAKDGSAARVVKKLSLGLACAALKLYFRHVPTTLGNRLLWDRIVRRHIIWRRFE